MYDKCVDGNGFAVAHDERVEIDSFDLGVVGDTRCDAGQDLDECITVHRRFATKLFEHCWIGQVVEHRLKVGRFGRENPEHNVGQHLGEDPAQTKHEGHAELGIVGNAHDQFSCSLHLFGDQQLRACRTFLQQLGCSGLDGVGGGEVETNAIELGLVQDGVARQFHHHGETKVGGRGHRLGGVINNSFAANGHAIAGKQFLGVGLRQCGHARTIVCWHRGVTTWTVGGSNCQEVSMFATTLTIVLVAFALTQIANLITTVYLHRALTHRALELHPALAWPLRILTWLLTGIRPHQWVAVHRKHHAHTDTDQDPHSPAILGWWTVQLTNVKLYRSEAANPDTVAKYARDIPVRPIERMLLNHAVIGLSITTAGLMLWLGLWQGLVAAGGHFVFYLALSGSVNGPGHHFGSRPFDNSATNLRWLALLTAGEGLHNHHHAAPTSARFGRRWSDLDFGWWFIRGAEVLRLATVRHRSVDALASR